MNCIGIDLHTNRFICCYRNEQSQPDKVQDKRLKTFELTAEGLAVFYDILTQGTVVLLEATITSFSFTRLIQERV